MGPIGANAGSIEVDPAGLNIVPADRLACDIGSEIGIAEEQARNVAMPAVGLVAEDVDTGLQASERTIDRRRYRAGPALIDMFPKTSSPDGRSNIA